MDRRSAFLPRALRLLLAAVARPGFRFRDAGSLLVATRAAHQLRLLPSGREQPQPGQRRDASAGDGLLRALVSSLPSVQADFRLPDVVDVIAILARTGCRSGSMVSVATRRFATPAMASAPEAVFASAAVSAAALLRASPETCGGILEIAAAREASLSAGTIVACLALVLLVTSALPLPAALARTVPSLLRRATERARQLSGEDCRRAVAAARGVLPRPSSHNADDGNPAAHSADGSACAATAALVSAADVWALLAALPLGRLGEGSAPGRVLVDAARMLASVDATPPAAPPSCVRAAWRHITDAARDAEKRLFPRDVSVLAAAVVSSRPFRIDDVSEIATICARRTIAVLDDERVGSAVVATSSVLPNCARLLVRWLLTSGHQGSRFQQRKDIRSEHELSADDEDRVVVRQQLAAADIPRVFLDRLFVRVFTHVPGNAPNDEHGVALEGSIRQHTPALWLCLPVREFAALVAAAGDSFAWDRRWDERRARHLATPLPTSHDGASTRQRLLRGRTAFAVIAAICERHVTCGDISGHREVATALRALADALATAAPLIAIANDKERALLSPAAAIVDSFVCRCCGGCAATLDATTAPGPSSALLAMVASAAARLLVGAELAPSVLLPSLPRVDSSSCAVPWDVELVASAALRMLTFAVQQVAKPAPEYQHRRLALSLVVSLSEALRTRRGQAWWQLFPPATDVDIVLTRGLDEVARAVTATPGDAPSAARPVLRPHEVYELRRAVAGLRVAVRAVGCSEAVAAACANAERCLTGAAVLSLESS